MKSSLLWRINDSSGQFKGYLFGTMHINYTLIDGWLDFLLKELSRCESFAAELDIDEIANNPDSRPIWYVHGFDMNELMGTKKFQKLRNSIVKGYHIDIQKFPQTHPFAILQMINEMIISHGNIRQTSIDQFLWNQAKFFEKECIGLEEFNQQLQLLKLVTPNQAMKQLIQLGRNITAHKRRMNRLTRLYLSQDIRYMYTNARKQLGKYRRDFVDNRNVLMLNSLCQILDSKSCFAAVGAGHLPGKNGLLALLKQQGYKVKHVELEAKIDNQY